MCCCKKNLENFSYNFNKGSFNKIDDSLTLSRLSCQSWLGYYTIGSTKVVLKKILNSKETVTELKQLLGENNFPCFKHP